MPKVEIRTLETGKIAGNTLCTLKNPKHEGYKRKVNWLESQMKNGLVSKILTSETGIDVGMIEYIPGEFAWRAVDAKEFMFIHCLFIAKKEYQTLGYGKMLIEECINDAKVKGFKGVATVTSKSAFLANKSIFEKLGFELVDMMDPDYELMALNFGKANNPKFHNIPQNEIRKAQEGLVIFVSDQCPFIAKAITEITETAKSAGVIPKIIQINSAKEAQMCPVAYGCFGLLYNGKILADHPISNGRFKNILNKEILKNK